MTVDLRKALTKIGDRLTILYGDKMEKEAQIAAGYQHYNPSVKVIPISNTKFLPHMERPDAFIEACKASRKQ